MSQERDFEEQRHFSRIVFDADAHLVSAEGSWRSKLLDISLKGALIALPTGWSGRPGDRLLLELVLGQGDCLIRMEVSVAHIENGHVGLRCEHIDLDSITHLRRLVELNLGDMAILNRELSELSS